MIAVIRIHGRVKLKRKIRETLLRLNVHHKLYCTLIDKTDKVRVGMVKRVRDYIAFGEVSDDLLKKLIEKRGEKIGEKKVDVKEVEKVLEGIKKGDWKVKKFFRLHPPIGGFKKSTKLAYPKGVLGDNKEIGKLLERML